MEPYQQPVFSNPSPTPNTYQATNPGKALGVASIVFACLALGLVGLIVGIIGLRKSKAAGYSNTPAMVGIVLGILEVVVAIIVGIFVVSLFGNMITTCAELGSGTHTLTNGSVVTCSD